MRWDQGSSEIAGLLAFYTEWFVLSLTSFSVFEIQNLPRYILKQQNCDNMLFFSTNFSSSILYVEEEPQQINNNNFTTGVRQKCITVSLLLIDTPVSLIPKEALNYFYENGPIFESL